MMDVRRALLSPAAWAALAGLLTGSALRADDFEVGGKLQKSAPPPVKASDEGEQAIRKMKIPAGLKCDLFAAEPMLANPVALCADERGRFYVVETFRFKYGVFDIREHEDWYQQDLACASVADRLQLLKDKLGPNMRRITTAESDKVVMLEDSSNSGKADKSTVFADGFNSPLDGVASSVLARKGNVYLADIPNLWLLKDTTGSGKADVRKSLSYGYGVRYAFLGHDLHGLRFGPDGKLYYSIGDRAANVSESIDGRTVKNTESGSVFRCNPDGTGLEIFATGLRNPQQLIFDEYGNLFTGDNNPDFGDPARWVYVVEGGDSGWREGYQHAPNPRSGGPWMAESLWQYGSKLDAESQIPPVAHLGAGPSGLAYYPGTGLNDHYAQHFFECDFRGGATGSGVHTFTCAPKGAGFEVQNLENYVWDILATDICFGPAGGTYITDWVQGWDAVGKGRIYHVYDPAGVGDPVVVEVKNLMAEGMEKRSLDDLGKLLAHRDMRIRQEAQFELADRGEPAIAIFSQVAGKGTDRLPRLHAIWGLGQIGVKTPAALSPVLPLLADGDEEVRCSAARVLGDGHVVAAKEGLLKLLTDSSSRVRFFASMALGKIGQADVAPAVVQMLRDNDDKDAWLRHAGVMALTWLKEQKTIGDAAKDASASVRMASLLTMRREGSADVAQFLNDSDPKIVLEAARAINDTFIEGARPALAALISKDTLSEPVEIRVLNSAFRIGDAEHARALAQFADRQTAPARGRIQALRLLGMWAAPGGPDYVMNLWRPLPDRDVAVARDAITPVLSDIIHRAPDPVRVEAVKLIRQLDIKDTAGSLEVVNNASLAPEVREAALNVLADQRDPKLPDAVKLCLTDKNQSLRVAAIRALGKLPDSTTQLQSLLNSQSIPEAQAAYGALASVSGDAPDQLLLSAMDQLSAGKLPAPLKLDVLEACSRRTNPQIKSRLSAYEAARPKDDSLAAYRECLEGGNAVAGNKIFSERQDVSCIRCHTVHNTGGIVGPKLDGVGTRQNRDYLMESIVYPNAKIAAGFESAVVKTKGGASYLGVVRKDEDQELQLVDANNKIITIKKSDISSRERGLSPMPEGLMKTLSKSDLRNLVEFLAELK